LWQVFDLLIQASPQAWLVEQTLQQLPAGVALIVADPVVALASDGDR